MIISKVTHTQKKTGLHAFKNTFLEKAQGGAVFLGLSEKCCKHDVMVKIYRLRVYYSPTL